MKQKTKAIGKNIDDLLITDKDLINIPQFAAIAYLMNPFSILNCVAQTTTVWSNFVLAAFFYFLSRKNQVAASLAVALETQKNVYPFVLIVPAALYLAENRKNKATHIMSTVVTFVGILIGLNWISYLVLRDWIFIDATYGFM